LTVLRSGSATDVGRVRQINQDLPLERPNLYAVADGMGGHVGGEVAARVAVETLELSFEREPTSSGLGRAFDEANFAVWQESQINTDLRGMGTTLTAAALVAGSDGQDVLVLANVGDSRAYVFSEGEISQVTADHSLAEERMRHGEISEQEAAVHPQRHILTRALGVAPDVQTDMWQLQLRTGDRLLLCSDGLSNEVDMEEMATVLAGEADPGEAARQLVDSANSYGGMDNITVVVVDVLVGEDTEGATTVVTPLNLPAAVLPLADADDPDPTTTHAADGAAGDGAAGEGAAGDGAAEDGNEPKTGREGEAGGTPPVASHPSSAAAIAAEVGAITTIVPAIDDTLAPGSRLGFDSDTSLAESGPRSDEFFLGSLGSTPVARASARVPIAPSEPVERPEMKESRRARRRRLGIPRRVTPRVLLFVLLVAAVPIAAYYVLRWYAYDNWTVKLQGDQIVVVQGQPGGVLWFKPRVVDRTGVTTAQILPPAVAAIGGGVQESSLANAREYVQNLVRQFDEQHTPPPSTTTTTAPAGITTTTTAPLPGTPAP
jgi:serine/threonine protein phosphatase PrpC